MCHQLVLFLSLEFGVGLHLLCVIDTKFIVVVLDVSVKKYTALKLISLMMETTTIYALDCFLFLLTKATLNE